MNKRLKSVSAGGALLLLAGCGLDDGESTAVESPGTGSTVTGALTVLAAASLTESFEAFGDAFEAEHPGLEVTYSFGPSSGLVEQVLAGSPGDVLATANTATMDNAVDGDVLAGEPVLFAHNTLTLAVPAGNPGDVSGLADLARDDLRIALCEPQVPCGAAAKELLEIAGVEAAPDTLETDVKNVTAKVSLGEVDAGLIYRTDAAAEADSIDTVEVPEAAEVVNDYPVAVLAEAQNVPAAEAFVSALTDELGRGFLEEAGFLTP